MHRKLSVAQLSDVKVMFMSKSVSLYGFLSRGIILKVLYECDVTGMARHCGKQSNRIEKDTARTKTTRKK